MPASLRARRPPSALRLAVLTLSVLLAQALFAGGGLSTVFGQGLGSGQCPRVADPKLSGGEIPISFTLAPPANYRLSVVVTAGDGIRVRRLVRTVFSGDQPGADGPLTFWWDGKDRDGQYVDPGAYRIHVTARSSQIETLSYDVNIVRLGIREIEAQVAEGDEWQMVYFRKGTSYAFYATPAIHEYINVAQPGEISDLDLDDGSPRPPAPVHTATDSPVLDGSSYERECYNYPLCYLDGSRPRFEVTMGISATSCRGVAVKCGYPITGIEIRGLAQDPNGSWSSNAEGISPAGRYLFEGPPLADKATRTDLEIIWSWQYRVSSSGTWEEIPGLLRTRHRIYTQVGAPFWRSGVSGTQYTGPWVEASDYLYRFSEALAIDTSDETGVVEAFIKGYFGQNGPLLTAIEGVIYDTYTMGGDGGATHYYKFGSQSTRLSRLLNEHALGIYVNCSDVASTSCAMLGMLGVQDVRMVYLGRMFLRAIWGIGCPDYTLDLWGNGGHGFSYHHIMTRDGAVTVCDACLWVDEDGDPDTLPGTPGFNCDRPWDGVGGYNDLSSTNNVTKQLDPTPGIE